MPTVTLDGTSLGPPHAIEPSLLLSFYIIQADLVILLLKFPQVPGFVRESGTPGRLFGGSGVEARRSYSQAQQRSSTTARTSMAGSVLLASVLLSPRMLPAERPSHS